jgi:beta-mannosidase
VLREQAAQISVAPLASTKVASYTDAQLLKGADPRASFAVFELLDGDHTVSRNLVFFDEAKNLQLPSPQVRTQWETSADGYRLTLTAAVLARDVWVSFGDLEADVSDNAFDMLPGQSVTLVVHSKAGLDALRQALAVQNLADVMAGASR